MLEFIQKNNFLRYHDDRYYSTKLMWNKIENGKWVTIYYSINQLKEIYEKDHRNHL